MQSVYLTATLIVNLTVSVSAQKDLKINTYNESKRETHENMDRNPNKSDRLSWQRLQQVHLNMN